MDPISAGILAVAAVTSTAVSALSQHKANKENKQLQQQTNDVSIELANTAHQREVADLEEAHLNPILSAQGSGAATPTLGTAQVQNELQNLPETTMQAAQTMGNMMVQKAQAENYGANTGLQKAQTLNTMTDTQYMPAMKKAEIAANYANAGNARAQADYTKVMTEVDKEMKQAETEKNKVDKEAQQWENKQNKELGTSKNEWGPYRALKNVFRGTLGGDRTYNPLMTNSARTL